jgi:hypothetical protein
VILVAQAVSGIKFSPSHPFTQAGIAPAIPSSRGLSAITKSRRRMLS